MVPTNGFIMTFWYGPLMDSVTFINNATLRTLPINLYAHSDFPGTDT